MIQLDGTLCGPSTLILALLSWWGARRTINQTREAHKPAKPTNSWGAQRTMIQLDGPRIGPSTLILALLTWWGAPRTINQTREAHKPAKPTNSWDALRTMIQLDGKLCGPSSNSNLKIQNSKFDYETPIHDPSDSMRPAVYTSSRPGCWPGKNGEHSRIFREGKDRRNPRRRIGSGV